MRLPTLCQLALNEGQRATFRRFVYIRAGTHMDSGIAEKGLIAQHLGHSTRLRCHYHDALAPIKGLATILYKCAQPPTVRTGAAERGHQGFHAALLVSVKLALTGRKNIREAQLTTLLQARLQVVPCDMGISQLRRVLAVALKTFFHLQCLGIEFSDMI